MFVPWLSQELQYVHQSWHRSIRGHEGMGIFQLLPVAINDLLVDTETSLQCCILCCMRIVRILTSACSHATARLLHHEKDAGRVLMPLSLPELLVRLPKVCSLVACP